MQKFFGRIHAGAAATDPAAKKGNTVMETAYKNLLTVYNNVVNNAFKKTPDRI